MKRLRIVAIALALLGALALLVGVGVVRRRAGLRLVRAIPLETDAGAVGLRFSPDGRFLAVASLDGVLQLVRTSDGPFVWRSRFPRVFSARGEVISFSDDGARMAATDMFSVRTLSAANGHATALLRGASETNTLSVSLAQDLAALPVLIDDTELRFTSISTGRLRYSVPPPHAGAIAWDVAFSPQSNSAAIRWTDSVQVVSTDEGAVLWTIPLADTSLGIVHFSPAGNLVGFWLKTGLCVVAARDGGRECEIHESAPLFPDDFAFSPEGDLVATSWRVGQPEGPSHVRLWSIQDGRTVASLDFARESASRLAFSPDGQTLAIAIKDDVDGGKVLIYATPR